ncbi:uncharacterized protein V1518DRAFT_419105 [Limtongia smithiae]|uniref:uncharacterized protein n=1 Tax=Limtongia smithiae TaxID=1125753 RepID=UPI0034CF9446
MHYIVREVVKRADDAVYGSHPAMLAPGTYVVSQAFMGFAQAYPYDVDKATNEVVPAVGSPEEAVKLIHWTRMAERRVPPLAEFVAVVVGSDVSSGIVDYSSAALNYFTPDADNQGNCAIANRFPKPMVRSWGACAALYWRFVEIAYGRAIPLTAPDAWFPDVARLVARYNQSTSDDDNTKIDARTAMQSYTQHRHPHGRRRPRPHYPVVSMEPLSNAQVLRVGVAVLRAHVALRASMSLERSELFDAAFMLGPEYVAAWATHMNMFVSRVSAEEVAMQERVLERTLGALVKIGVLFDDSDDVHEADEDEDEMVFSDDESTVTTLCSEEHAPVGDEDESFVSTDTSTRDTTAGNDAFTERPLPCVLAAELDRRGLLGVGEEVILE